MRVKGLTIKNNNTMAKKAVVKKAPVKKAVATNDEFNSRKESILLRCEQAGVIEPYLKDINNSTNDEELNEVLMDNVQLRPFIEE